jgi:hypothetical protein
VAYSVWANIMGWLWRFGLALPPPCTDTLFDLHFYLFSLDLFALWQSYLDHAVFEWCLNLIGLDVSREFHRAYELLLRIAERSGG